MVTSMTSPPDLSLTQIEAQLPEHYTSPALTPFGSLRQMVRGSGSPSRADFSQLTNDTDPAPPNICAGTAAQSGSQLNDSQCDAYDPF